MSTIISNNVKTAKEIYWNVVNYMTAEYRDILVDLKRREDNDIYDGYEGYVELLIERKTIVEEVRTKLGISNGLVYGLNHELIEIDNILDMAERYVSSACNNKESERANQIFWIAVHIIDREYGDYLRLLGEHLNILETNYIPQYNTWNTWFKIQCDLLDKITTKFNNEYNIIYPNEIIIDEYGREWNYNDLIVHAAHHIGTYNTWEERIRHKEKEEGAVDWMGEYRFHVTPH